MFVSQEYFLALPSNMSACRLPARVYDFHVATSIWKGSWEHVLPLGSPGPLQGGKNGSKWGNEIKVKMPLWGRKQGKRNLKTREALCPISLILHISIKAYWKLKLLWNVQEAVHNKHSKYIVNSKQNKHTVSKKHVFTYLFIRKNVYS